MGDLGGGLRVTMQILPNKTLVICQNHRIGQQALRQINTVAAICVGMARCLLA